MKRLLMLAATFAAVTSFGQVNMPQPSPTQTIKQNFGLGTVEVNYSRPGVKGRKIFGDVVPFDKVWRTGANGATIINFSDDVIIGGTTVKAGKYGLLSIPGKKDFTIIITKDLTVNQPALYKQENDVVRVTAPVSKLSDPVETLSMQFTNVKNESCELQITWDKLAVSLPIAVDIKDRIKADVEKNLASDKPNYQTAATFYFEWVKDNNKALSLVTKGVEQQKDAFWLYLLKARIEKELGDKVSAKASAEKCIEYATAAKNSDYVRMAQEDIIKKL
ncbi:DUF2911 domain-containing protein [Parasediminibacterium paludis]|uniref:DUF2911 domain-containing protein n=1 Tax=Parasediminibacterium paludis TaxID=908966 RepID=A0ABV8PS61_9BACT